MIIALVVLSIGPGCTKGDRPAEITRPKSEQGRSAGLVSVSELAYRSAARVTVTPRYPRESLERGVQGVCVTAVHVTTSGSVDKAGVLQAPDPVIGAAAVDAARQWRFEPLTIMAGGRRVPVEVDSKLTFYFSVDANGLPSVLDPAGRASPPTGRDGAVLTGRLVGEIEESGLASLMARVAGLLVVDIRPREAFMASHRNGAKNIPVDELALRARELRPTQAVVIDCFPGSKPVCQMGADELTSKVGVNDVWLLLREDGGDKFQW